MSGADNSIVSDPVFNLPRLCRYFSQLSPQPTLAVEGASCVVRHVNDAFLELAGAGREHLIGRPFAQAVPEGDANGCNSLFDRVYRTGVSEHLSEQQHSASPVTYWSYAVWAILGRTRRPVGVMIQVADSSETTLFRTRSRAITEALLVSGVRQQELAEISDALSARLTAAVSEKEYFIAVLSHELRTPLTPVLLAASMLRQDPRFDSDVHETMQMIHRNITLEARLIDDLLDMTRIEHGKLNLDRCPVDLRQVLKRAVEVCTADSASANLTIEMIADAEPQIVNADAGRLQQVFSNLIRNAIKFSPAGGRIRVRSRFKDGSFTAEVSDDGEGIEPEFISRAFKAFEQGDKGLTRKAGLGLGLAICKTIVDLHGGVIDARSEGSALGSTFTVKLPAMVGVSPLTGETGLAGQDRAHPAKALQILLVEDHVDTARVLSRLLKAEGYSVQWAANVAEGLQLARAKEFDLLLSDLGLPDGTGVELMQSLRREGSTLRGIVISGYGQDHDIKKSLEAGFAAHLVKPLSLRKLRDAIDAIVASVVEGGQRQPSG